MFLHASRGFTHDVGRAAETIAGTLRAGQLRPVSPRAGVVGVINGSPDGSGKVIVTCLCSGIAPLARSSVPG